MSENKGSDNDDWGKYEKLVLEKLNEHGKSLKSIHEEVIKLQIEMGVVKTKVGFIGAMSGAGVTVFLWAIKYFTLIR